MAEVNIRRKGWLQVEGTRLGVVWERAGQRKGPASVPDAQLDADLLASKQTGLQALHGRPVEFELGAGGQVARVGWPGTPWSAPDLAREGARGAATEGARPRAADAPTGARDLQVGQGNPAGERPRAERFRNPYNFVPAPPRETDSGLPLGDRVPARHDRYQDDLWSGRLSVTLTTETPLLVLDLACGNDDGHKKYAPRIGLDGTPYLPPTSLKGMLRSAYEAVTNSRFGVFESHDRRLAYRMEVGEGLRMVPARIEQNTHGGLEIVLLRGTTLGYPDWRPNIKRWVLPAHGPDGWFHPAEKQVNGVWRLESFLRETALSYAAWLGRYKGWLPSKGWGGLDVHRGKVWAHVRKSNHGSFWYWEVDDLKPPTFKPPPKDKLKDFRGPAGWVKGHVCIGLENAENKHHERVFFTTEKHPPSIPLNATHKGFWNDVMASYKGADRPPGPTAASWSRHILSCPPEVLEHRTLCYAAVKPIGAAPDVVGLYPVMIARKLFDSTPASLLDDSLKPPSSLGELSPADRVFGWVNQDKPGAYKGQLRIGPATCAGWQGERAVRPFAGNGLALSILSKPKPQQARFYVAKDRFGAPQADGTLSKEAVGYEEGKGLRGRKFYPHQDTSALRTYWDATGPDLAGRYREYRHPLDTRDPQNRSLLGWIEPKTAFRFDIDVINLSSEELGALLWLLRLNEGQEPASPLRCFKLGLGKPLGFGSVSLRLDRWDLRKGAAWRNYYSSLDPPRPDGMDLSSLISCYKEAVPRSYKGRPGDPPPAFEEAPFIKGFLRAAEGYADSIPTHYPRTQPARERINRETRKPEAVPSFEWFVDNERGGGRQPGQRLALPAIDADQGLPYRPVRDASASDGSRRERGGGRGLSGRRRERGRPPR
jgi:CRISPR-associated protein (TIGR03986 family)